MLCVQEPMDFATLRKRVETAVIATVDHLVRLPACVVHFPAAATATAAFLATQ